MDFLGIGIPEALFFLIIMLIILGPTDMVKLGHTLGTNLRKLWKSPTWRMIFTASDKLRTLPHTLAREAGMEEMRQELKRETDAIKKMGREITREAQLNPPPKSPPVMEKKEAEVGEVGTNEEFAAWTTPPDEVEHTIAPPSLMKEDPPPTGETHRGSDEPPSPTEA